MEGRDSKKSKIFQKFKKVQNHSRKCPNMFSTCLEMISSKKNFAQCNQKGRDLEKIQKNRKIFKISKMSKNVPKMVQTCFEHVLR